MAVDNNGAQSEPSTLTTPVPSGWTVSVLADSLDPGESCAMQSGALVCTLNPISLGLERVLELRITPSPTTPIQAPVAFSSRIATVGVTEQVPSNNEFDFSVYNAGVATVEVSATASRTTVPVQPAGCP